MLQILDDIPIETFPPEPKLRRPMRLKVKPEVFQKPPKKEESEGESQSTDADDGNPAIEENTIELQLPTAESPRPVPYLWRND